MEFKDKIVVVTGAANGIGHGLAARFVAEGATVIASDLPGDTASAAATWIGARFVPADVGKEAEIAALVADVLAREGRIDLFCSNAGIASITDPMTDEAEWQRTLAINQMSHVWAARHVLPAMLERGEGYLLNTASAAGLLVEHFGAAYTMTKHAAVGFAEWLAVAYRARGIRVSVLCPEGVLTRMTEHAEYLRRTAIPVEQLVDVTLQAIRDERFMITTHPKTLPIAQARVADFDTYIGRMAQQREAVMTALAGGGGAS
ncbi:MAG TPA: SDR family oxidoreductase [Sphingomonas sp.]|jgi:NAD(P)-dependent dehydrogenase (short-subunit alcohol dehydrogenase family)|uniref:SDR family oxidoreductase n=1 Tax=Sphingomonas sp. TaxID=28214 RepID=UPI002ED886FE